MPKGPSATMRRRAGTWLTDLVALQTVTRSAATRATMHTAGETVAEIVNVAALVRQNSATDEDGTTVERTVREFTVWITDEVEPVAGQRLRFTTIPGDTSLEGTVGEIVAVERGSHRAVRRLTVQVANDE